MKHYDARQQMSHRTVAITNATVAVSLTTGMNGKEYMVIQNGGGQCYIGDSTVTAATGYILRPYGAYDFGKCTPNFKFWAVTVTTTTTDLQILET